MNESWKRKEDWERGKQEESKSRKILPAKFCPRWSSYSTSCHHFCLSQIYVRAGTLAQICVQSKIKVLSDSLIIGNLYIGRSVFFSAFQQAIKHPNWVSVALRSSLEAENFDYPTCVWVLFWVCKGVPATFSWWIKMHTRQQKFCRPPKCIPPSRQVGILLTTY